MLMAIVFDVSGNDNFMFLAIDLKVSGAEFACFWQSCLRFLAIMFDVYGNDV